jgi:hypothetical protein|tara:strand:- start:1171 stop:2574 length:1404 start_codon:yes stop_codon:yes gene_type:complete
MANVKITDLTELAAGDLATNDVLPIVDINVDATKKVTIASLDTRSASNDFITFTRLNANLNVLDANADAIEARRVANVTVHNNEDTALQARIAANTLVAASNDFITFTRLNANINVVQDNVASVTVGTAADTETRLNANLDVVQDNVAAVETRRTNNIAGAISTVLTTNLTASRALISGSGGKIEVSPVSSTELGYVDGVTGAIQTQIDALEARRAANNITTTFTDDVVITGNLTINGDTTTVSTTNLDVEDRMIMLADGVSGSPSADVGLLFNRGNQGNAAFFYDESGKTFKLSDTKDPKSNTSLSPVTASNLSVGIVDAATVKFNGTSVQDAISANVTTLTNEDTALQARITANATITTAVEARRVANIAGAISTVTTSDLTADRVMITNGSGKIAASSGVTPTELGLLDGLTLGTVAASKAVTADSNGDVNFIREVDIDGNVVIGTNDSNTVTIVGKLDLGAFS